jgi:SAM-dependent methyltransferase
MDIDWPPRRTDDPGAEYVRYAEIYDTLFGDLKDDVGFYAGRAARELPADGEVLEIGTGTGRLAERFIQAGYRVTGIDVSAEMLARAAQRLDAYPGRYRLVKADVRTLALDRPFSLVAAPYGMVAHLLTDDDRRAAFRRIYEHVRPGGSFCFDDLPDWMAGPSDATRLEVWKTATDPATGLPVRLMSNLVAAADAPLSVRYDIIDWLKEERVSRRLVIRVVFRNIALPDELRLLAEAGFEEIELCGDFDGRPFDAENPRANKRLIFCCRRPL